jgi:hippurate hydrolase
VKLAARTALVWLLLLAAAAPKLVGSSDLEDRVEREVPSLLEIYEHLHANPELSYQEDETARYLALELRRLGFQVTEGVGDYGIEGRTSYGLVGVLENGNGPTAMVRTDLDGLPVRENTGLSYASRAMGEGDGGVEVPVMHACGHDLHMTSFLGTARMLSRMTDSWRGTLVMIGQPAEERGAGAKAMLDDGLFMRFPKPDYALAWHSNAVLPAGEVGLVKGYALANVDSVDISVRGRGGHGAWPHKTKDPVTLAAQIVVNLQTIVSRQISPFDPAVVTVGSIHGGTKHNIIPDEVKLQLTVRSYKPEVREHLLTAIREVAVGTARGEGWPDELLPIVDIHEEEHTPATYNDPELIDRVAAVFESELGKERVHFMEPVMGGEDFSYFGIEGEIPVAVLWLGAVDPADIEAAARESRQLPPLHSAEFSIDPGPAIRAGVTGMTAAVLDLLRP